MSQTQLRCGELGQKADTGPKGHVFSDGQKVLWIFDGKTFRSEVMKAGCPQCGKVALIELPKPLLDIQPDDTTHVCLPFLGGCNQGYAMDES